MYGQDAVGELVTIDPAMVLPAHAATAYAPSPIFGLVLDVDDDAIGHREAMVYIVTPIPGIANGKCWIPVEYLDYLDAENV